MNLFAQALDQATGSSSLASLSLHTLQVNVGLRCNLECRHCHLAAGPRRTEQMSLATMEDILALAQRCGVRQVDLTGGAPELHPHLRDFIQALRQQDIGVQVRSNLAVLLLPEMADLGAFFRDHQVQLVGSLPCYLQTNVDAQRGEGTHQQLVEAIRRLNQLGYGREAGLTLNLVYNPGGAFLPPNQCGLEAAYRRELAERHGLVFSHLLTITNMPIGRFRASLRQKGEEGAYLSLLRQSFNAATLEGLMCRHQVSIGWDGQLYDCDFNLALGLPLGGETRLAALDGATLARRVIQTGDHCLACTAGSGSSCGGALAA